MKLRPLSLNTQGAVPIAYPVHTAEKGNLVSLPPEAQGDVPVPYSTAIDMYYYGELLVSTDGGESAS
jgi:hypothetical protein